MCFVSGGGGGVSALNLNRTRDYSLLIVPPSAGRCAGVLRVPAQLIVDRLPGLLTHTAVVAALLADLLVEHVEINWNKHRVRQAGGGGEGGLTLLEPEHRGPFYRSISLLHKSTILKCYLEN